MKCILVDDEPLAIKWLEKLMAEIDSIQIVGTFSNASEANAFMMIHTVDLVFLDIEMANLNGLDFVKSLARSPLIIFVTAYPQHAIESYELGAIDYLLKPVRPERLVKSIDKARNYLGMMKDVKDSEASAVIKSDHVFVRADKRFVKLFFSDILFIEGLKDYVIIHVSDKQKIITAMNVKTIFDQLPQTIFARVSKSHIINTQHIHSIDSNSIFIQNEEVPIGTSYREDLFNRFVYRNMAKR